MPKLTVLVGPPGVGKSTYARKLFYTGKNSAEYVNQDEQGKEHFSLFMKSIADRNDIIVDRMNFNKEQRARYLEVGRANSYFTEIIVLHQSYYTCLENMRNRVNHETIKSDDSARKALHFFFSKYERPEDSEANRVIRIHPIGVKPKAIVCDLDGTLCDLSARKHHVENGKKDWKNFFEEIPNDKPFEWCVDTLTRFATDHEIVFCSGRPMDHERTTKEWIHGHLPTVKSCLFMRPKGDFRPDEVIKEILLDFEILTRFTPKFILDDRKKVVDMWRRRGYTCLQADEGNF